MQLYWQAYNGDTTQTVYQGDALEVLRSLPSESVHCCVTSPPYWRLRDYSVEGQLGLESTPEEYVTKLVEVFREVRRVLRKDGTIWLNLGDSYAGGNNTHIGGNQLGARGLIEQGRPHRSTPIGFKSKDLIGIPWMVAFALRADGWYLRQDIIWHKPNPMPESVKDRCTKAHEYIFLLSKSRKYYYDHEAIKEPAAYDGRKDTLLIGSPTYEKGVVPGQVEQLMAAKGHERWKKNERGEYVRNKRSVWTVPTKPFPEAHFAVYPPALITPCILAGCPVGGTVLDPFAGSGTTLLVATQHHRKSIGIELNPEYIEIAKRRLNSVQLRLVMESGVNAVELWQLKWRG